MSSISYRPITRSMFFDRKAVTNAADRATRRVLSRFGAFVRTRARTSIRKRKRISEPGKPPSSHTGRLRRGILFGFDRRARSVVVGPMRFRKSNAPALLEHGGRTQIVRKGKRLPARYRARPFMAPALEKERPKLAPMWRDSIK